MVRLRELGRNVQEDLVIMHRGSDGVARVIWADVSFPSGWEPETLMDADFQKIHEPVPGFANSPKVAASIANAMIERGPWERFVWILGSNNVLDHHPETGTFTPWSENTQIWFRVERQLTIPFPELEASLFVIRTYIYPLTALTSEQHAILLSAVRQMSPEILEYKGLENVADLLEAQTANSVYKDG